MNGRPPFARAAIAAAFLLLAGVRQADASLIVIPNASFETPDLADNAFTDTGSDPNAAPGWKLAFLPNGIVTAGVWDPTHLEYSNSTGNNATLPGAASGGQTGYIYLEQLDDALPEFLVSEFTTAAPVATIQPNTIYTLTVALGHSKAFDTGDVSILLMSEDVQLASTFIPAGSLPADMFTDVVATFTTAPGDARAGRPLSVQIAHSTGATGGREVDIDNVRLDATSVPEPTGAAAALLALGAAATRRRRPRR